jgi:hypothetical protein
MSPLLELVAVLWTIVSLSLSIWTYNDAFLLSYSRAWAAAVFFVAPAFFPLYLYWSRWRKIHVENFRKPAYEVDSTVLNPRPAGSQPAEQASISRTDSKTDAPAAETVAVYLSRELPRCPGCNTAVSFYDVRCIRCGQPLKKTVSQAAL